MELNKKKSLLTPAAPTVWGMIHGDISKQQDLIDKINSAVEGVKTAMSKPSITNYYTKSEVDEAISNIEVEVDTSNLATKQELQNLKNNEVQTALSKSDAALTTANSAEQKITELRTYVDEQIGGIDTMTDDILA